VTDQPVTVRVGGVADVERAQPIWSAAHERRRDAPTHPAHIARFRGHFRTEGAFWVIAEQGDRLAGMALAEPALADDGAGPPIPGRCHIGAVFVNPAVWGQGVGGRVMDALLAEAERRGYQTAQLWTQAGNERALRLYEARGFRRNGREMPIDDEVVVQLERP
jgi:GNAT superfamily N-acetyltransferase